MLKKIRLGTPVQISIDALGPQEFSSRVTEIVPASDPGSRSSTVKIDLFDEKGRPAVRRFCAPVSMERPVSVSDKNRCFRFLKRRFCNGVSWSVSLLLIHPTLFH